MRKADCTLLWAEYLLPAGCRYALPKCRVNRLKNSFVPATIGLLNSIMGRALLHCVYLCVHLLTLLTVPKIAPLD